MYSTFLGQKFAVLEMTIIIAMLLRRFIIKIDKPKEIAEKSSRSLKPIEPIKVKFVKRL